MRLKEVHEAFNFRVLRENRRVVKADDTSEDRTAEIETFHLVLSDIAMGVPSARVRAFLAQAYVRGMLSCGGTAVHALVLPKLCVRMFWRWAFEFWGECVWTVFGLLSLAGVRSVSTAAVLTTFPAVLE